MVNEIEFIIFRKMGSAVSRSSRLPLSGTANNIEFTAAFDKSEQNPSSHLRADSRHEKQSYEYALVVVHNDGGIPYESLFTEKFLFLTIELPGISLKEVELLCMVSQGGYDLSLKATKQSIVEGGQPHQRTRILGPIRFEAAISGVFTANPEVSVKDGLFKFRLHKRLVKEALVEISDF